MADDSEWRKAPLSDLVDHILCTHHAYLHRQLPLLSELLTAHTRQYWLKHPEFLKAHSLFHQMKASIEQHLIMEETAGFPLTKAHEKNPNVKLDPFSSTIDEHVTEHLAAQNLLKEIRSAMKDYSITADFGSEVAFTFDQLKQLESDLAEHIHLENDILFPRVRAAR